ncbi:MAG: BTAD domain-containing putative transcriptional regulator [Chloroflexota bacterium]
MKKLTSPVNESPTPNSLHNTKDLHTQSDNAPSVDESLANHTTELEQLQRLLKAVTELQGKVDRSTEAYHLLNKEQAVLVDQLKRMLADRQTGGKRAHADQRRSVWQTIASWFRRTPTAALSPVMLEAESPSADAQVPGLTPVEGVALPTNRLPSLVSMRVDEEITLTPLTLPAEEATPSNQNPADIQWTVYTFGAFQLLQNNKPVVNLPANKGIAILKYLLLNRTYPVPREVLMDTFWPEAKPEQARNSLNVAVYGLRNALKESLSDTSHIINKGNAYFINPEIGIWLDCEAFEKWIRYGNDCLLTGETKEGMSAYHRAEGLYQEEFLIDDRYEEWILPLKRNYHEIWLDLLSRMSRFYFESGEFDRSITLCQKILKRDDTLERIHRRLMRCYIALKQTNLAARQYHVCVEAIRQAFDMPPEEETEGLFESIRTK